MKVGVTGGSGFLGSHVVEELVRRGHEVTNLDLVENAGARFVRCDLAKLEDVVAATRDLDAVCHLGAVGDVYLAFEKPYLAALLNVVGTGHVMEASLRNGIGKVVYASSWEVYGEPQYQPIDEEHPCRPDHPYNITKLAGEQLALSYDRLKGAKVLSLRLGTAYGRRMRPNSVFSIFVRRALAGQPLVIKGSGTQSRQFTHATDIARAFAIAVEQETHGQALNIVSMRSIQIRQLAEMVASRFSVGIDYEGARLGDVPCAVVSADKAASLLGWKASVAFEDGLEDLMDVESSTKRSAVD